MSQGGNERPSASDPYTRLFSDSEVCRYARAYGTALSLVPRVERFDVVCAEGEIGRVLIVYYSGALSEDFIKVMEGLFDVFGHHHFSGKPLFDDVGLRHISEISRVDDMAGMLWQNPQALLP